MADAYHELGPELYQKLRKLASYYMKMERCGHTLQPTALVHEAFLRVYGSNMPKDAGNKQIIATLAGAMRHILVDYARRRSAAKRSAAVTAPTSDERYRLAADVLAIDEALAELQESRERQVRVVELRYFAGMTEEETAEVLCISRETVKRDWRFARAWLKQRLVNSAS